MLPQQPLSPTHAVQLQTDKFDHLRYRLIFCGNAILVLLNTIVITSDIVSECTLLDCPNALIIIGVIISSWLVYLIGECCPKTCCKACCTYEHDFSFSFPVMSLDLMNGIDGITPMGTSPMNFGSTPGGPAGSTPIGTAGSTPMGTATGPTLNLDIDNSNNINQTISEQQYLGDNSKLPVCFCKCCLSCPCSQAVSPSSKCKTLHEFVIIMRSPTVLTVLLFYLISNMFLVQPRVNTLDIPFDYLPDVKLVNTYSKYFTAAMVVVYLLSEYVIIFVTMFRYMEMVRPAIKSIKDEMKEKNDPHIQRLSPPANMIPSFNYNDNANLLNLNIGQQNNIVNQNNQLINSDNWNTDNQLNANASIDLEHKLMANVNQHALMIASEDQDEDESSSQFED